MRSAPEEEPRSRLALAFIVGLFASLVVGALALHLTGYPPPY